MIATIDVMLNTGTQQPSDNTAGGVGRLGYLIPEWPGQSHVWAWREICALRNLGLDVVVLSTRRPPVAAQGRHGFAPEAMQETTYLWPPTPDRSFLRSIWFGLVRPRRLAACLTLAWRMPPRTLRTVVRRLALVLPALRLAELVHRTGIEHLHTPIPADSAVLCMMARRMTDAPYSLAIVNQLSDWGEGLALKLRESRFATLVAEYLLLDAIRTLPGLDAKKLTVVRHGVDTNRWSPRPAAQPRSDQSSRVLSIGRLTHAKGFDVLIDAVDILRKRNVRAELEIIGEGPARAALEAQIKRLELGNQVCLSGSRAEEECLASMRSATVFALASRQEGTPVVCLEAMATGVPVVASSVGGIPEIIRSRVTGLLVPADSAALLAAALEEVLLSADLRRRLAAAAHALVSERFDSVVGAKMLIRLLREPLSGTHRWHASGG